MIKKGKATDKMMKILANYVPDNIQISYTIKG